MKREIKFRAWDNSLKEILPNVQNHINDPDWAFGRMIKNTDRFTVEQFTGLKDKNGVEIYEGDILKLGYPVNYGFGCIHTKHIKTTIHFDNGCFWFSGDGYTDCNWHHYSDFEVIGNIHDNPELL